jgi:hypothetical protein
MLLSQQGSDLSPKCRFAGEDRGCRYSQCLNGPKRVARVMQREVSGDGGPHATIPSHWSKYPRYSADWLKVGEDVPVVEG